MATITKRFSAAIDINEDERAVTAVINAAVLDRDGEVVLPTGCDLSDYEKNPLVLFAHDYYQLPVGKCVAIKRDKDNLVAKTVFASRPATHPEGEEWFPDTLYDLFKQGVLRAFSIGFEPVEMRDPTKGDMDRWGSGCRRVFSKWKLFEYSVVPVPANPDAVATAVGKGVCKAAFATKVLGYVEPPPPAPAAPPEPPKPAPRKTVLFVVNPPAPPPAMSAAEIQQAIRRGFAKAAGRLYYP